MNPITPGRYRTRDGRVVVIELVDDTKRWPVMGESGELWSSTGGYDPDESRHPRDLVSRIDDAPNPLASPLEWALAQLEPSLDPDWQAAHAAALEALKLAKQK
jgi:hypothetical protein